MLVYQWGFQIFYVWCGRLAQNLAQSNSQASVFADALKNSGLWRITDGCLYRLFDGNKKRELSQEISNQVCQRSQFYVDGNTYCENNSSVTSTTLILVADSISDQLPNTNI